MDRYKYLVWAGTAALLSVTLFMIISMDEKLNAVNTANTVSFAGEGKVLALPDVAVANLSILTEAVSSKTAQDENSRKSKAVTEFLKTQGIEERDIRTTGYNIYPQYKYPQNDRPEIASYQVNQMLEVRVRNLDMVSKILDGVVTAGVNQVNGLTFVIDDPEALKAQARAKAIEDAKEKASALRGQVGINLGRIVNFSENIGGVVGPYPIYARDMAAGYGGGGGGPSVPTGENEIIVNVTLTYQIR